MTQTNKALVFISHITEEKEIAILFKELIEASFLGMIEVFVSSDEESITMGQKWLDQITAALKKCAIEIVICSPASVKRPWINFEAGAGWIRDIPVIPLCHSGAEPNRLPSPLNLLQAAKATEISSLKLIFPVLAQAISSKTPSVDFTDFVNHVKEFEERYTFWNHCSSALSSFNKINSEILKSIKAGNTTTINITETEVNTLIPYAKFLEEKEVLKMFSNGSVMMGPGVLHGHIIIPMKRTNEILNDHRLIIS